MVEYFSNRIGKGRNTELLQVESCDTELRKGVWNAFYGVLPTRQSEDYQNGLTSWIAQFFYRNLLNSPIDEVSAWEHERRKVLKQYLLTCEWNRVYNFIEVACECFNKTSFQKNFENNINAALQKECSGYRLVDGMIVEITSELDRESLANAISGPYEGPREHIRRAAELLFDRQSPDARNSIKESISAVEGMVRIIAKDPTATLGSALKKVESSHYMHPSLIEAFSKLYGYSSDGDGIRHGMLEGSKVGLAEAKYMLLSCSAFINYLVETKA